MNADTLVKYNRYRRAEGLTARHALSIARLETAEPRYPFLATLGEYGRDRCEGRVGAFTVEVVLDYDEDARLGDDDVTGTFTDRYEEGAVKNTRSSHRRGGEWYVPSEYVQDHAYDDLRKAGMSKAVARDAYRELVDRCMYEDAEREFYIITVTVSVGGRELASRVVGGYDTVPTYDGEPYLRDSAAELVDEALHDAREAIPAELVKVAEELEAAREALLAAQEEAAGA